MEVESLGEPLEVHYFYDNAVVGKSKLKLPKTSRSKPKRTIDLDQKAKLDIDGEMVSVILNFCVSVKSKGGWDDDKSASKGSKFKYQSD